MYICSPGLQINILVVFFVLFFLLIFICNFEDHILHWSGNSTFFIFRDKLKDMTQFLMLKEKVVQNFSGMVMLVF